MDNELTKPLTEIEKAELLEAVHAMSPAWALTLRRALFELDTLKDSKNADITGAEEVEVKVRDDGKVLWVNTEKGCVLRICRIEKLVVDYKHKEVIT